MIRFVKPAAYCPCGWYTTGEATLEVQLKASVHQLKCTACPPTEKSVTGISTEYGSFERRLVLMEAIRNARSRIASES